MIKKIVIVGNGAAGLFCAAALKKNLPNLDVIVVYDPDKKHIGVGESLGFNGPDFFRNVLGMTDEHSWLQESKSTYKLGVRYIGWDGNDDRPFYFSAPTNLSYKVLYKSIHDQSYHYYNHTDYSLYDVWAWAQKKGLTNLKAPQEGISEGYWFLHDNVCPIKESGEWLISPYVGHSYHINAEHIRTVVHERVGIPSGVKEIAMPIQEVKVINDNISSLVLQNGEELTADLFIDCTGFAKLLVNQLPYEFIPSEDHYNDTSLVGPYGYQNDKDNANYTTMAAMDYGWRFSVPMIGRSGEGYQFNSRFVTDTDQLVNEYERKTGKPGNILRRIAWTPGFYRDAFVGNTIALGLSAGFVDVFDANNFSSVLMFIKKMITLIKKDKELELNWKSEYNWYVNEINTDIKFRIDCAFQLAPKNNTEYWKLQHDAGQRNHTVERLQDYIFSSRKKNNLSFQNNAYSQHVYLNTALYYGIPLKTPDYDIDQTTWALAKEYFEFVNKKGRIQSSNADSLGHFYDVLHEGSTLNEIEIDPTIETYSDFLG
jgi:tryptophan halogenase